MIRLDVHQRRLWVCGQRTHHGALGVLMTALGVVLAVHDRRDARDWFRRS